MPAKTITSPDGVTLTVKEWSEKLGLSKGTINKRLARGFPIEDVLSSDRLGRINAKKLGKQLSFLIAKKDFENFQATCKRLEISQSTVIRRFVQEWAAGEIASQDIINQKIIYFSERAGVEIYSIRLKWGWIYRDLDSTARFDSALESLGDFLEVINGIGDAIKDHLIANEGMGKFKRT
jgi:hypothetical protein